MDRIDYFKTHPESVLLSPFEKPFERLNRSFQSNNLLEITILPSRSMLNAQAQSLLLPRAKRVLKKSFAGKSDSIEKLLTIISEITGNVPHSLEEGYCVMQTYVLDRRARIHIAIADLGIGVRNSLSQSNADLLTDLASIQYALKLGTTSKTRETRGLGLVSVYNSIKELRGLLRIRSGTASILFQGNEQKTFENLHFIPGTQVEIVIRE